MKTIKKLTTVFFLMFVSVFALSSCGGETEDVSEILAAALDSVLYMEESETAETALGLTAEEVRELFVENSEKYYSQMGIYTREQCRAVSEKILQNASRVVTYRVAETKNDGKIAAMTVYIKPVDAEAFYAKYAEISADFFSDTGVSEEEKSILSFGVYMEALDHLTASQSEIEIEVKLENKARNWKVIEPSVFLANVFGAMIGADM